MGVEYRPVSGEELELLDDCREVSAEDKSLIRGMLKRFKIGRAPAMPNQQMAAM